MKSTGFAIALNGRGIKVAIDTALFAPLFQESAWSGLEILKD